MSVSGENVLEIIYESGRELVRSSRFSAIWVLKVCNPVLPCSLNYCSMEVGCIAVTMKYLVLFISIVTVIHVACYYTNSIQKNDVVLY
jgi:hypothetical protein